MRSDFEKLEYDDPEEFIDSLIEQRREISNDLITQILQSDDDLLKVEFLDRFLNLTESNMDLIRKYIVDNIVKEKNMLVLASMIDFATNYGFDELYGQVIFIIERDKGDNVVPLFSVQYLHECYGARKMPGTIEVLKRVLNDNAYYQNAQVASAFVLLRFTCDSKYKYELEDLILNGDPANVEILSNILKVDYNQREYFYFYDHFQRLVKEKI